jgi:hypothetical protein
VNGGVEMHDILYYQAPFGFLGKLAELIFVNNKVKQIFDFREKRINELFPVKK